MERQIFPEIVPCPRIERAGQFLAKVWNLGRTTELCLSEHIREEQDQLKLSFED